MGVFLVAAEGSVDNTRRRTSRLRLEEVMVLLINLRL